MAVSEPGFVQVRTAGAVPPGSLELAQRKVAALLRHAGGPVLFARVMLTMAADPAVAEPASVRATVSLNGRHVRAQATGVTMSAAVGELADRLRVRLDRAWPEHAQRQHRRRPSLRRLHYQP